MFVALWIACSIGAAVIASSKKRNVLLWLLLGLLFGPLGLLTVGLMSRSEEPGDDERKCPYCAEVIKKQARVCKHCGNEVGALEKAEHSLSIDQQDAIRRAAELQRNMGK